MTRKFSKPFLINLFTLGWRTALAAAFCVGGGVRSLRAQLPETAKEKKSYIRFWNMLPISPTNNLLVLAGDKPMFGVAPFDLYTDYFSSPVGSYSLTIKRVGEKEAPVQKIPVALQGDTYITLLATQKGAQVNVELINDTPDPTVTEVAASLVVRSFFAGGRVTVGVTGGQAPQPIPDYATVTLNNLPMTAGLNINVQATMPTTPPASKSWDLPADFSVTHHATLLLVPDRYGRLKPTLDYAGRVANPGAQRQREKDGR